MAALPIHPTTGLRAIYVSERTGRAYWPIRGASAPGGAPAEPAPPAAPAPPAEPAAPAGDRGFPTGTPVEQMQPAEQVAYWKAQSRKHEDRVKSLGNLTADQLAELRARADKHDALEFELSSEADKKAAEARKTAVAETEAKFRPQMAETAFRIAIGDRKTAEEVDDFIGDLNLSRFLTDDGRVDTAKVLTRVEQFAPAKGNQQHQQRPGPSASGQGNRGPANGNAGDPARAWLAKQGIKVD